MASKNLLSNELLLENAAGGKLNNKEIRAAMRNSTNSDDNNTLKNKITEYYDEAINSRTTIKNLNDEKNRANKAGNDFMSSLGF